MGGDVFGFPDPARAELERSVEAWKSVAMTYRTAMREFVETYDASSIGKQVGTAPGMMKIRMLAEAEPVFNG